MARNDPFEADLHRLKPEILVLLIRSLNERAEKLNEARRQRKMAPKRVLVPWKVFTAKLGAMFVSNSMIYHHTRGPTLLSGFLYKNP